MDKKARKRTGARKRQQRQRLGAPTPPDQSEVRSPQTATIYWVESGRYELATGFTTRVSPAEDLPAFPLILAECRKYGQKLGSRMLKPVLVAGIEPVAKQLDEIVSFSGASEELDAQASP